MRGLLTRHRQSARAALIVLGLLVLAFGGLLPSVASQAGTLQAHGAILIDGDADLCNAADVVNGVDVDGIRNCGQADGSAAAPYVISGWTIRLTSSACAPPLVTCGPPPCSVSRIPAAVAVCNTTKHIVIEHVDIENHEARRDPGARQAVAALLLAGTQHLTARWLNVSAAGLGIAIHEGAKGEAELPSHNNTLQHIIVRDAPAPAVADPTLLLVELLDSDVDLHDVRLDDNGRNIAMQAAAQQDLDEGIVHSLRVSDSTIRGGREFSLSVISYQVEIRDSRFESSQLPTRQDETNGNLALETVRHTLINNTFEIANIGLYIEDARGRIQFNSFTPADSTNADRVAIRQPSGTGCVSGPITYNDFWVPHVINDGSFCTLNVPYNYWDGGPNTASRSVNPGGSPGGSVNFHPLLPLPLAELPMVSIARPGPGSGVHGKFILEGTATPGKTGPLQRVEATDNEDDWAFNATGEGTSSWLISWDATAAPLGPFQIWVRACGTLGCGVPATLRLQIVERPLPPIALLDASPRVAQTGDIVTLDASASYSPHSRPIAAYRFDLGNGARSEWVTSPTYEVRYTEAGEYPASVEVMDAAGLQNTNLPQAIIRVRSTDKEDADPNPVPFPGVLGLAAVLVALALIRRPR